jgi:hypothetical protein
MYRANTQLHQSILREIEEAFPGRMAKQAVRQTIHLAEAARAGLSIFEFAPASSGALDLYALCFELFALSPEQVKARVRDREAAAGPREGAEPGEKAEPGERAEPGMDAPETPESVHH